jgi:predicted esterase
MHEDPHAGQPIAVLGKPLGESHAVMIMVHGRNAGPTAIMSLCPVLDREDFTYLAPAAADGTWYPHSFMAERATNEPFLSSALDFLGRIVDDLIARGIRRDHILLLGFSQGACLTAEFAYRNAARYGGIIVFSGGLIGPAGTTWDSQADFTGTRVFLGCSDSDAHIPRNRVAETAAVFTRMNAAVTEKIYRGMGHAVNPDEIRHAQLLMDAVLAERTP